MKTIKKLTLTTDDKPQTLSLSQGYRLVRIEYLVTEKLICLWVEVPLRADIPQQRKTLIVKKTHQPVPMEFKHLHTAIDLLKPEAFHIYEVPTVDAKKEFRWQEWRYIKHNQDAA